MPRRWIRAAFSFLVVGALTIVAPEHAPAQAWVDIRGHGSVFATYSYFRGGDHLYSKSIDGESTRGYEADGDRWFLGRTFTHTFTIGADYSIASRLGLLATLAHVSGRYEGRAPVDLEVDDGDYHHSLQDAHVRLRYVLLLHPVVVTPSIGYTFPMSSYSDHGHAALGLGFREWQLGVSLGRSPVPLLEGGYVHAQLLHDTGEARAGHRIRRTIIEGQLGRQVIGPAIAIVSASFLNSSGGQDWLAAEGSIHAPGPRRLGTAFSQSRFTRLGVGVSSRLVGSMVVSANFISTINGQNVEDGNFLVIGTSWRFVMPFADSFGQDAVRGESR